MGMATKTTTIKARYSKTQILDQIATTTGITFNSTDLSAYALGVGLGAWVEWMFRGRPE